MFWKQFWISGRFWKFTILDFRICGFCVVPRTLEETVPSHPPPTENARRIVFDLIAFTSPPRRVAVFDDVSSSSHSSHPFRPHPYPVVSPSSELKLVAAAAVGCVCRGNPAARFTDLRWVMGGGAGERMSRAGHVCVRARFCGGDVFRKSQTVSPEPPPPPPPPPTQTRNCARGFPLCV